jgi:hypothetical protein
VIPEITSGNTNAPVIMAFVPFRWAATAGLVGDGIREAESAMTAAEACWSRRAEPHGIAPS